jgi:DNA-binding winged helix-turn-helix (wHTH) protein
VLTLRRKLEQAGLGEGGGIETMRQQGYRFSLEHLPEAEAAGLLPSPLAAPSPAPASGAGSLRLS